MKMRKWLVPTVYAAVFLIAVGDWYFSGGLSFGWVINIGIMCWIISMHALTA